MRTKTRHALIIEDSPENTVILRSMLEREGFMTFASREGAPGIAWAREHQPDLVILDLSLPDGDGLDFCTELRTFSEAYVIMVTSRDDEVDKIVGFTVGADDYVTKPFSPRELSARVRALSRRPRVAADANLRNFGDLVIDPMARQVLLEGRELELTKIEYDLLDQLTITPRKTLRRNHLVKAVWGDWFGTDHVLEVHIAKLRRKLTETAISPRRIVTVRGVGYRFEPQ
jgi:DNA-binding response OmpR family regulator